MEPTGSFTLQERAAAFAPAVRMLLRRECGGIVGYRCDEDIGKLLGSKEVFAPAEDFFSDYSTGKQRGALFVEYKGSVDDGYSVLQTTLADRARSGKPAPAVIGIQNTGLFSVSGSKARADATIRDFYSAWNDNTKAAGPGAVEEPASSGRIAGKIVVVTGAAQGFGKGIAESLAREGAYIAVADINGPAAKECAEGLCREHGDGRAIAVRVDVTQEDSIKNMTIEVVLAYGGIDVFISNAGILKAGSLEEMDLKTFELVTKINYTAYFLGTKYVSRYMKIQNRFDKDYWSDIIQINSKSGLEGSNKNFAYAGGKFGSIGLTQSYALELVDYHIKVNAICPGNFFEGPLWSDPQSGLFAQYLRAGKVPGAETIADVKTFYESKVPMKRGCSVRDVAVAALYIIEQRYETGQAVPVTGGQVMLR